MTLRRDLLLRTTLLARPGAAMAGLERPDPRGHDAPDLPGRAGCRPGAPAPCPGDAARIATPRRV